MLPSLKSSLAAAGGTIEPTPPPRAVSSMGSQLQAWLTGAVDSGGVRGGVRGGGREALEYWLYVLYDAGDAFFDSEARETEVRGWLSRHLVAPLAAASVTLRFALLRFDNVVHKPGPAFNFMMAAAAEVWDMSRSDDAPPLPACEPCWLCVRVGGTLRASPAGCVCV